MNNKVCAYKEANNATTIKNESPNYDKNDKTSSPILKTAAENCDLAINTLLKRLPELDNCFNIHGKIGEGTFSNVYLASLKGLSGDKKFAIKHLIPTCHPRRMEYELDCLNRIGGKDNVVSCDMTMREADCVVFIMPYLQHQRFADYVLEMSVDEARLYMKNLLLALRRVHSFNIIHRDIKPSNFLYNRENKQFLLVDFGLAQKVKPIEDSPQAKVPIPKTMVTKRKREDDDVENERMPVKRFALQTLSNDLINSRSSRSSASIRYSKQPLSIQQQKDQQAQVNHFLHINCANSSKSCKPMENTMKRQPLSANSPNMMSSQKCPDNNGFFKSLMPSKSSIDSGASFVRVQNSQVQAGSLFPRPTAPVRYKGVCECMGKPQVCNICLTRKPQYAPRAGTPGFRPPEVLLKYPHQTTAVDMWSAGIIMLCIVSGCYPFFRSPDDLTALSEIITVFGTSAIKNLAKKLGRNIICNETRKPLNLRFLCESLRCRKTDGNKTQLPQLRCKDCHHLSNPEYGCFCEGKSKLDLSKCIFPSSAFDLLSKLLDVDPETRISAELALQHPFIIASE